MYSHPGGCQLHPGSREVGRSEWHSDLLFAESNAEARERRELGHPARLCNRPSCLCGCWVYSDVGPVGRNGIPTYSVNALAGVRCVRATLYGRPQGIAPTGCVIIHRCAFIVFSSILMLLGTLGPSLPYGPMLVGAVGQLCAQQRDQRCERGTPCALTLTGTI